MKTLNEIAMPLASDKAPWGHNYTPHYDRIFSPFRNDPIRMLEIGVNAGGSILMWLEYFLRAEVYGIDIVRNESINDPRYHYVKGDQGSRQFWSEFSADHSEPWDIVIDDGSHQSSHILVSFECLWPRVKLGGFYIIEDLNCAYDPSCQQPGIPSQMDLVKSLLDEINHGTREVSSLQFHRELAIIQKI